MTTIAAVQGEGWAVIGYDSRVSEEDGRTYILPKDNGKVFKNLPLKNDFHMLYIPRFLFLAAADAAAAALRSNRENQHLFL